MPSQGDGESRLVLHKIKPGESVSHIARKYNVPPNLVAAWNDLSDINRIKAGQQLALYVTETAGTSNLVTTQAPVATKTHSASIPTFYNVKSGDSLWTISRRFKVTPGQLKKWNNLKSNLIHPGTRLRLSEPAEIGSLSILDKAKASL